MALKIGVSACLLGQKVRFDGKDKRNSYLTDGWGRYLEFLPICPEVETGMGVPREKLGLFGSAQSPRMIGLLSGTDWTGRMTDFACRRIKQRDFSSIDGYILQQKSPSCGLKGVKVFGKNGIIRSHGVGLYARVLKHQFPLLPIEEEARLAESGVRENFIARIFAHHRLRQLWSDRYSRTAVIRFHDSHELLLLAHSPKHCKLLEEIIANIKLWKPRELRAEYSRLFMETLSIKPTIGKNINVIKRILVLLKERLSVTEKRHILKVLESYHREKLPLVVLLTLLRSYVDRYHIDCLANQVYLYPDPDEILLRNHT